MNVLLCLWQWLCPHPMRLYFPPGEICCDVSAFEDSGYVLTETERWKCRWCGTRRVAIDARLREEVEA